MGLEKAGNKQKVGCWLLIILCFFGFALPLPAQDEQDLGRIQDLITRTKQQLSKAKKQETSVLDALLTAQQELDHSEQELERLDQQLQRVQQGITNLTQELVKVEQELERLNKLRRDREDQYNRRLVAVYKYGPLSYLEIMVAAESVADLISKFEMVAHFLRADAQVIKEVTGIKREITSQQQTLQAKKEDLEKQRATVVALEQAAAQERKLNAVLVQRAEKELTKVQQDRKRFETALDELEATSREIEAEIKRRQQQAALGTGKIIWPLVTKGQFTFWQPHAPDSKREPVPQRNGYCRPQWD